MIFVDLALAQMAALGVAVALVLEVQENEHLTYALALGMTFWAPPSSRGCAARSDATSRSIPSSARLATAQAAVFLVLEKSPWVRALEGDARGQGLFTWIRATSATRPCSTRDRVAHFLLRKPFFEITNDPQGAAARGRKLFGGTSPSMHVRSGRDVERADRVGVLLVFGLLVIPAVAGLMAAQRPGPSLAVGWAFGFVGSLAGLMGSIQFDLPAAPSILVSLSLLLVVLGAVLALRGRAAEAEAR